MIKDYRALSGIPDEMVDATGQVRPAWKGLVDHLTAMTAETLAPQIAKADQYLLDSGVFYRQYGGGQSTERPWPLAHVPVVIGQSDWDQISRSLVQRADLLEALARDFYGDNRMIAEGRLPASLVASNPEWLRPMVGVAPKSGHFLHFIAFELGRGPDGKWWVLADRTQAPSGAGYALENRVATSKAFSELYSTSNVYRLAGFFRQFRDALLALRTDRDARVAILSPGPLNETYFEHAYIARYLGFTLVQGEDLAVENAALMVRTVSGLRPVDVLWRRMDSAYVDPIELDPQSRIGTPGLVSALRDQGLTVVNAVGSGVLETRALMAFLPKLAPALLGEKLMMPNIATWWCGGAAERATILASPENLMLSSALGTGLPFDRQDAWTMASALAPDDLRQRLARDGANLVAQETVSLSTTPALVGDKLLPRPMTLRVFLARTEAGWQVMPGGFARIGAKSEPTAIGMQQGGSAADVWVVSDAPVAPVSMVPTAKGPYRRSGPGALPSRAADNLFWLGRYVERTEGILRLLRAHNIRLAESGAAAKPVLESMEPLFASFGVDEQTGIPQGLLDTLADAIGSAGRVRDRFSPDAWSALADLDKTARRMALRVATGDDAVRALSALLRKLAGISGLVHENMYRFLGWRFLTIGRLHERAMGMLAVLAVLAKPGAPDGALDLAVELGDSVLTHRRRFTVATSRDTVIDLLGLDGMNPRSVRHQIDALREQVSMLPDSDENGIPSPLLRAVLRAQADLATATPEQLTTEDIWAIRDRIGEVSELVTGAYFL
jgi:uncharacterized circularly permuted ATP-grasp superfamily protein/uncharacterized alpha-E superfamily protein